MMGSGVASGSIPDTTDVAEPGLRERKRRATRQAIQRALLTQALERGYDNVTVEEISRLAGVSPRTFFNYFGSKDEALIGDVPTFPDAETVERFVARGSDSDIFDDLVILLSHVFVDDVDDLEIHRLRRRVLRSAPLMAGQSLASMRSFEEQLLHVMIDRLRVADPALAENDSVLTRTAWLYVAMAFAVIRHAWRTWVDSDEPVSLTERLAQAVDEMYTITRKTR